MSSHDRVGKFFSTLFVEWLTAVVTQAIPDIASDKWLGKEQVESRGDN